ncbi:hypothetical protein [Halarchaeum sp. P4]|uniref:hypothetical protein n=1 Tax=Halarchaeum sp. P4 TaxID=3421639 RepID=UPI003EB83A44
MSTVPPSVTLERGRTDDDSATAVPSRAIVYVIYAVIALGAASLALAAVTFLLSVLVAVAGTLL